jgi:mono/diheme cytochrome c family protein
MRQAATILFALLVVFCVLVVCQSCGSKPPEYLSEAAKRGWTAYHRYCTICHNPDPFQEGTTSPGGPSIVGSSQELILLRVTKLAYPKGYKPKRDTKLMTVQPQAVKDVPDIYAYLKEVRKPQ